MVAGVKGVVFGCTPAASSSVSEADELSSDSDSSDSSSSSRNSKTSLFFLSVSACFAGDLLATGDLVAELVLCVREWLGVVVAVVSFLANGLRLLPVDCDECE